MIKRFFTNWNLIRIVKVLLGLLIVVQAIANQDFWLGIMAAIFMLMPIFNLGCCANSCTVNRIGPIQKPNTGVK